MLFLLAGCDLNQMADQAVYLRGRGFNVRYEDVYPGFETEDELRLALMEIRENHINGWWNYQHLYKKYGIGEVLK